MICWNAGGFFEISQHIWRYSKRLRIVARIRLFFSGMKSMGFLKIDHQLSNVFWFRTQRPQSHVIFRLLSIRHALRKRAKVFAKIYISATPPVSVVLFTTGFSFSFPKTEGRGRGSDFSSGDNLISLRYNFRWAQLIIADGALYLCRYFIFH